MRFPAVTRRFTGMSARRARTAPVARRRFPLLACALVAFGFVGVGIAADSDPGDINGGPRFRSALSSQAPVAP